MTPQRPQSPTAAAAKTLVVNEIFYSIQGESNRAGLPTSFIRLTGCPLRCRYCDTEYAFNEGKPMSLDEIMQVCAGHRSRYVTVTGGEPLAQANCPALLTLLCDHGYQASLETSGALDIESVDPRVARIVDVKTPGSGEAHRNRLANLRLLSARDQVKFVICDRQDYEWSRRLVEEHALAGRVEVLFSPSHQQLAAVDLADWILADRLPVRLQVQLHKYLWGERRGV